MKVKDGTAAAEDGGRKEEEEDGEPGRDGKDGTEEGRKEGRGADDKREGQQRQPPIRQL